MDSQEEKMVEIIQRNQEKEAIREGERRRKEIQKMKLEKQGSNKLGYNSSNNSMSSSNKMYGNQQPQILQQQNKLPEASSKTAKTVKGLSLTDNKLTKQNDYMDTMKQEFKTSGKNVQEIINLSKSASLTSTLGPTLIIRDDVHLIINEKLLAKLDRDGNILHFEVRGELDVLINKEQYSQVFIKLENEIDPKIEFKIHPNYNKPKFLQDSLISFKDLNKKFIIGSPNGILKWRLLSQDSSKLPLIVNCWPSNTPDGIALVNMDYECRPNVELHDVSFKIPIVAKNPPKVSNVDGNVSFDEKNSILEWFIPIVNSSNQSGNLDFELDQWKNNNTSHLFPIHISFSSSHSLCDINVSEVLLNEKPIKFSIESTISVDSYTIE